MRARAPRVGDLVEAYLTQARPRLRARSLESYTASLTVLLRFLGERGIERIDQVTQATAAELADWLSRQVGPQGRPLATETQRTYLRQIDFFWGWCEREGLLGHVRNPKPRAEHKIARTLDARQLEAMIAAMPDERDRLLLRLMCETGLRIGELVRLNVMDLEAEPAYRRYFLHVRAEDSQDHRGGAKDHRDRLLPISLALYRGLQNYIERLRPQDTMSDALFLNKWRSRRTGLYDPVSTDTLQELVKRAARRAGIDAQEYPKLGPHLLRKSFTRIALSRGMDSEKLRVVLGHADTRQIREVYGQLNGRDVHADLMKVLYEDRRR